MVKYTLSNNKNEYILPKMTSLALGQYLMIPIVLFVLQSILKIPTLTMISNNTQLAGILYVIIPLLSTFVIMKIFNYKGSNFIDTGVDEEKLTEAYMSESAKASVCDESQNKYKYAVGFVTVVFCILCFGPLAYAGILQPLNGLLFLGTLVLILKTVYSVQDNKESYNILNPVRENEQGEIDLDTNMSVGTVMACISVSAASLLIFRNIR